MRKVKIITDSCADLTAAQLTKYDIDYAKMSTVYNGVETPACLTWSEDEVHALYNIMRDGNRITTAQVSVEEFQRVFEMYLKQDMDIVYIGCSSKSSGSVNTGFVFSSRLEPLSNYPGSRFDYASYLKRSGVSATAFVYYRDWYSASIDMSGISLFQRARLASSLLASRVEILFAVKNVKRI